MKLFAAVMFLAPLASAQFYVKDQQFRYPAGNKNCDVGKMCDYEEHRSGDHHDFSINFVEVKGNGEYFDRGQLQRARDQIVKATFGGKQTPLVFIYVHGWHNNANELKNDGRACPGLNGDVAKFRDCGVGQIAKAYPTVDGAPPAVVGIYLAWQGLDFTPAGLVTYIVPSYMLRRFGATRVGTTGMCEAVNTLLDPIQRDRDQYVVVLMGHSFGARVLENATEKLDPRRDCGSMRRHRMDVKSGITGRRPPADLIFYVNAASSSSITYQTIKDWSAICRNPNANAVCDEDPFYLAVTSRTDFATGLVQPIANIAFFWFPTSLKPPRFELIPFSAANTFFLHTHRDPKNLKSSPCPAPSVSSICFTATPDNYAVDSHTHHPRRFWILNTGRRFIRNHGDVWNPKIFAMVRKVIENNVRYNNGRQTNQTAGAKP